MNTKDALAEIDRLQRQLDELRATVLGSAPTITGDMTTRERVIVALRHHGAPLETAVLAQRIGRSKASMNVELCTWLKEPGNHAVKRVRRGVYSLAEWDSAPCGVTGELFSNNESEGYAA